MNIFLLIINGCLLKGHSPYTGPTDPIELTKLMGSIGISIFVLSVILLKLLNHRREKYLLSFSTKSELEDKHYDATYNQIYISKASFWKSLKHAQIGKWGIYILITIFVLIRFSYFTQA